MKFWDYQKYFDKCVDENKKADLPDDMFDDWQRQYNLMNNIAQNMQRKLEKEYATMELTKINEVVNTIDNITKKALNITTMYLQIVNQVKKHNLELDAPNLKEAVKQLRKEVNNLNKMHESPKTASIEENKQQKS